MCGKRNIQSKQIWKEKSKTLIRYIIKYIIFGLVSFKGLENYNFLLQVSDGENLWKWKAGSSILTGPYRQNIVCVQKVHAHTHTPPLSQYLQRLWPHLWALPGGGVDHFCCPPAWWLCCYRHGPAAPSASAQRFHKSGVWQCHKPRELRLLHGSTWGDKHNINWSRHPVSSQSANVRILCRYLIESEKQEKTVKAEIHEHCLQKKLIIQENINWCDLFKLKIYSPAPAGF